MTIQRIQRASSLVEEVSLRLGEEVQNRIASGDAFLPPERLLAEQLGVSRPVVREATIRLELQGLVEIQHGIGTKIVQRLHKPLIGSLMRLVPQETERQRQLMETRLAIEPAAAAMAAENAKPEDLKKLWAIHQRLEVANDALVAIECDLEFHHLLADASGNLMFRLILDSLADIGRECRQLTIGQIGKEKAISQHLPILQAIDARDSKAARQAMQLHMEAAHGDMAYGRQVASAPTIKEPTFAKRKTLRTSQRTR